MPDYTKQKGLTFTPTPSKPKAAPGGRDDPQAKYWQDYTKDGHQKTLKSLCEPAKNWQDNYVIGRAQKVSAHLLVQELFIEQEKMRNHDQVVQPGHISYDHGDVMDIIRKFFERANLPAPRVSKQAWDALWVLHERERKNEVDLKHCSEFIKFFCAQLLRLSKDPLGNGSAEVAKNVFIPAEKGAQPDWHNQYTKTDVDKIKKTIDNWDSEHIANTVGQLFAAIDKDGDNTLQWNNSEIQTFMCSIFKSHGLPLPDLTQSQWYMIYRTFNSEAKMGLSKLECEEFANFLHGEIKKGDTDLHQLLAKDKDYTLPGQGRSAQPTTPRGQQLNSIAAASKANSMHSDPKAQDIKQAGGTLTDLSNPEIEQAFREVDIDGDGKLDWNNSEIRNFVKKIFEHYGMPVPNVQESVWYTWYREVDHDNDYEMEIPEAIEFAKHVMERILQLHGHDEYAGEAQVSARGNAMATSYATTYAAPTTVVTSAAPVYQTVAQRVLADSSYGYAGATVYTDGYGQQLSYGQPVSYSQQVVYTQ